MSDTQLRLLAPQPRKPGAIALNLGEPLSRRTDPLTSYIAAEQLGRSGRWAGQKSIVLAALKCHPGATSAELARAIGGDRYVPSRRLPDLERDGLVTRGPARLCRVTHQRCITWRAVQMERDLFGNPIGRGW